MTIKSLLFFTFIFFSGSVASVPDHKITIANSTVQAILGASSHPYLSQRIFSNYQKSVEQLYLLSAQSLIWLNRDTVEPTLLTDVFNLLGSAKDNGLNQQDYQLALLQDLWRDLKNTPNMPVRYWQLLDTAISFNVIHFLADIHFGRINPLHLSFIFPRRLKQLNLVTILFNALQNHELMQLVHQIEPQLPDYHYLKQALLAYQQKTAKICPIQIKLHRSIHPQQISPQLWAIQQRLSQLNFSNNQSNKGIYYSNDWLVQIIDFQIRHGLKADGIIGKKTIAALNIPQSKRIEQIALALERFRWLPDIPQSSSLLMINIPTFRLWAYQVNQHHYQEKFNMRVIVGQAKDWQSPIFTAKILYLEFSPYWNIPDSILQKEILPKILEDSHYLTQQNIELVTGFHHHEPVIPFSAEALPLLQEGLLKARQRPGRYNALGRIKFMFPNRYNVYLHDTPNRHAFSQPRRDLSHGCIRVEQPIKLADFLLQANPRWNRQRILQTMESSQPKHIPLKSSVPVIIFYSTTLATEQGAFFYNDIYHFDPPLAQALSQYHSNLIASFPSKSEVIRYAQSNKKDSKILSFSPP